MELIGISGRKRVGKSTLASIFKQEFEGRGKRVKIYAFADELKKELDPLFLLNAGVSAFTEDPVEKELLRPTFISWGTGYWRQKDPDHWIKKLAAQIKKDEERFDVGIVADCRFASNELPWLRKQNAKVVYLVRYDENWKDFPPAGKDEEENDLPLRNSADFVFSWKNSENNCEDCYYIGRQWFQEIYG